MADFNLDDYIRKVPNFPKPGVLYYDITSILISPKAFSYCIDAMMDIYQDRHLEAVAAIESRGFLFAAPFALRMGLPLLPIRKKGKLPGKTINKAYSLEYGTAEIEVHVDDVPKGKNFLVMDDLIATGGTIEAAASLITDAGGKVTDVFGVIGLPFLHYDLAVKDIPTHTLINYESE
jgi:adenine phosphoribosyltransferase